MEAIYETNFLLLCVGIIPAFRFVWQFFLKDRNRRRSDANASISIFRQQ